MAARGRRSGFILIVLALILIIGVVAAYLLLQQRLLQPVTPAEATAAPVTETVDIVITTQNIPRGVELTADVLTTIPYPKKDLVEGMFFTSVDDVVGKRAKTEIPAQLPVTGSMVLDAESALAAYPSFNIPANYTAMSIPINQLSSVAYGVQPGDHVMVVGCMLLVDLDADFQTILPNGVGTAMTPGASAEGPTTLTATIGGATGEKGRAEMDGTLGQPIYVVPSEEQRPRLVCQNVVQDAVVLGVGDFKSPDELLNAAAVENVADDAAAAAEGEAAAEPAPVVPQVITLVLSPQDSVSMNYMLAAGVKLNLALRNPTDANPILTDAVTQQYLMDQKGIPLPAKLPYGIEPAVRDLSGNATPVVPAAE